MNIRNVLVQYAKIHPEHIMIEEFRRVFGEGEIPSQTPEDWMEILEKTRGTRLWGRVSEMTSERINLAGADLSDWDLRGVNLAGADLTGARLARADLRGAVLSGITAQETDFSYADLTRANLANARVRQSVAYATNFTGIRAQNATLIIHGECSVFDRAQLVGAKMTCSNLTLGSFLYTNLQLADISYALLDSADFYRANLFRANLAWSQAESTKFVCADLRQARLRGVRAKRAEFTGADLTLASFEDAKIEHCSFRGAVRTLVIGL